MILQQCIIELLYLLVGTIPEKERNSFSELKCLGRGLRGKTNHGRFSGFRLSVLNFIGCFKNKIYNQNIV